jgi:hypothetical protein
MTFLHPVLTPFAIFSPCRRYRYVLGWPARIGGSGIALFALSNPSTATAEKLDATLTRCVGYAQRWGYEWAHVVNARAWRETDPRKVPEDPLAIGPDNNMHIAAEAAKATIVIVGWGQLAGARGPVMLDLIRRAGKVPHALAVNDDGTPRHPLARGKLSIPKDVRPVRMPDA